MENVPQTRRGFLASIALAVASAGLLWRYLTPRGRQRPAPLVRVAIADIPGEGALVFREQRLAVMREGERIYALSLVCTHLGCTVTVSSSGLECPCHGSRFDRQGQVQKGPADRPLPRLQVEDRNGILEVFGT